MTDGWTAKAYSFFDTLAWIACLNMLWLGFSLAGLVLFGVGPSTIAAHDLVRRRVRGDAFPMVRTFWRNYSRNFAKGNALGLPLVLAGFMLVLNWRYFSVQLDFGAQLISAVVVVVGLMFAAVLCYIFPMFVRYEMPLLAYIAKSSRFAMCHLAGTVLLLMASVGIGYASLRLPGLIPFLSFGAWFYVIGWLCDKFFIQNDAAVAEVAGTAADQQRSRGASTAVFGSSALTAGVGEAGRG